MPKSRFDYLILFQLCSRHHYLRQKQILKQGSKTNEDIANMSSQDCNSLLESRLNTELIFKFTMLF